MQNDTASSSTQRVLVLVLPEVNLLDLSGPVQVFDAATHLGADYLISFVSETPQRASAQGLHLAGLEPLPTTQPGDLVLVPGPRLYESTLTSVAVTAWLQAAHHNGARIAAVCTGAAALGEAGLLNGRRCTTHWSLIEPMRLRRRSRLFFLSSG